MRSIYKAFPSRGHSLSPLASWLYTTLTERQYISAEKPQRVFILAGQLVRCLAVTFYAAACQLSPLRLIMLQLYNRNAAVFRQYNTGSGLNFRIGNRIISDPGQHL